MRHIQLFYIVGIVFVIFTCSNSDQTGTDNLEKAFLNDSTGVVPDNYNERSITRYVPPQHGCTLVGNILPKNQLWLEDQKILFVIKADSSTYDQNLGDSHRILEVYDTENCNRTKREILPINESPDFPYYLARITYNQTSQLVAVRGFKQIFVYDLANDELLPIVEPQFSEEIFTVDAQSGLIQIMELWENYIVGFAQDNGAFVINLENKQQPQSVLPFALWKDEQERPHALFLLPSQLGGFQAIIPSYNSGNGAFSVNPIFDQPQEIDTENPAGTVDSRYLVFRGSPGDKGQGIAIDISKRSLIDLPPNIAQGNNKSILNWLEQNGVN